MNIYGNTKTKFIRNKVFTKEMAHINITNTWNTYFYKHSKQSQKKLALYLKTLGETLLEKY